LVGVFGMTATRGFCVGFALLALMAHGATAAAETLAEAVKRLDAKYLNVPDIEPGDSAPKIEAGGGEEDSGPAPEEISLGAIKAALTYVKETSEDGDTTFAPVVTVFADGKEVAKLEGDPIGFGDPPVSVQIAELDPGNPHPEVVVSFYTGGAHCCSLTSVIHSSADGSSWSELDVGEFDGGPMLAVDLDNDGRYEFETRDNAFLYTFACYACSETPLQVLAVEDGKVKDVSSEPRFRKAHEAWLKHMIENVPEDDVNGFLAGYVAEKSLLGQGKEAWELMLAHYDKGSTWGLETCTQTLDQDGECPGQMVMLTFPDALERMLNESGYTVED
jgi:hypothetical protein